VKTGVQVFPKPLEILDSGFRRNDGKGAFSTFYEFINIEKLGFPIWPGPGHLFLDVVEVIEESGFPPPRE
jgi:hypothetical protein